MMKKEKLVIHGNEFYVIDLDCLEKKGRNMAAYTGNETTDSKKNRLGKVHKFPSVDKK